MTAIVLCLCTVNKSAETGLQTGHVSVVYFSYFSWKWNFWIHWSLWKEIQVPWEVHTKSEGSQQYGICTSASVAVLYPANPRSSNPVESWLTFKLWLAFGGKITERRMEQVKGAEVFKGWVTVCGSMHCTYNIRKEKTVLVSNILEHTHLLLVVFVCLFFLLSRRGCVTHWQKKPVPFHCLAQEWVTAEGWESLAPI